jgi:intracellular sulfur oxidation DsrE/DsrF family protein
MLASLLCGAPAAAQSATDKPFAEKRIVLQISDPNPFKQTLVLNVASNLVKAYGPDKVDIEIVAFGPGLRLLFAENANADRIDNLAMGSGVRFSACQNTMRNVANNSFGKEPKLNPHAAEVGAGVVRILDLVDQGYVLIKP